MKEEIVYMIGIVGVGFLVNYTLRALPFLLFGGRNREVPGWIKSVSGFISPVIIGGLILYAYSGSAWRTPWPYLAGVVTVGLHLWKRNPLVSIVAGTAVYMLLLNCCGCSTRTVRRLDASCPELRMTADGVYLGEEKVDPHDLIGVLEDEEIPKERAIHIRLERDLKDLRAPQALRLLLAQGGYTRSVFVTSQHGEGETASGKNYDTRGLSVQDDIVMFTVTREGVRYGWMTPVGREEVVKCLEDGKVRKDQLIRLCGLAKDYKAPEVMDIMQQLEAVLNKAGYVNVKRFWVEPPKKSAPPARTKNGIRYKRSDE